MWRSKKFILTVLLTVVVLGGILGGYAVAKANDEDATPPQAGELNFLDKVVEIYEKNTGVTINSEELQKAFNEVRAELRIQAREQMRQRLIDEGLVTQEQLDELEQWLESRPDFPTDEFEEWLESRPDIDFHFRLGNDGEKPLGGMFRGFHGFGKEFGDRFRGWCAPDTTEK